MVFVEENSRMFRHPARRTRHPTAWCLALFVALLVITSGHCEPVGSGYGPDVPIAWSPSVSIWFFSGRAELDVLERLKIAALAARSRANPGLDFGIHRPIPAATPGPGPGWVPDQTPSPLGPQRLSAIHDAMVAAGIPADHIHVGEYADRAFDVDRRIVIFVRPTRSAAEASRPRGEDDDVSAE